MILVVGSHRDTTARYAEQHGLGKSTLFTGTETGKVFHTSIADCPDVKQHIPAFSQVYWAESAVVEFFNYKEYLDTLYMLKQFPNVVNINTADPYLIRQSLALDNNKDSAVFIGCSHTYGIGLDRPEDNYINLVSQHFDVDPINAGEPGKGNHRSFEVFNQTEFCENQIVVIQLTDLGRLKYFAGDLYLDEVQERPLFNVKDKRSYLTVYNDKQLLHTLLSNLDAVVHYTRAMKLRFVFFYLGDASYHGNADGLTSNLEYYLQDYPEYIPNMLANTVDRGNDGAHFGAQSHSLWAQAIINKIETLYK